MEELTNSGSDFFGCINNFTTCINMLIIGIISLIFILLIVIGLIIYVLISLDSKKYEQELSAARKQSNNSNRSNSQNFVESEVRKNENVSAPPPSNSLPFKDIQKTQQQPLQQSTVSFNSSRDQHSGHQHRHYDHHGENHKRISSRRRYSESSSSTASSTASSTDLSSSSYRVPSHYEIEMNKIRPKYEKKINNEALDRIMSTGNVYTYARAEEIKQAYERNNMKLPRLAVQEDQVTVEREDRQSVTTTRRDHQNNYHGHHDEHKSDRKRSHSRHRRSTDRRSSSRRKSKSRSRSGERKYREHRI